MEATIKNKVKDQNKFQNKLPASQTRGFQIQRTERRRFTESCGGCQTNVMFSSGSQMTYFVLRGNRKGNVQVQDCTVLSDGIVDLFTPLNMGRVSSGSKTTMKQFIDTYLNGYHQSQDSMVKNICKALQKFD